jgi:hypothetical protein
MRRRTFIAGLGGVVALPFAAHAQHGERVRRVGVAQHFGTDCFGACYRLRRSGIWEMSDKRFSR